MTKLKKNIDFISLQSHTLCGCRSPSQFLSICFFFLFCLFCVCVRFENCHKTKVHVASPYLISLFRKDLYSIFIVDWKLCGIQNTQAHTHPLRLISCTAAAIGAECFGHHRSFRTEVNRSKNAFNKY